MPDTLIEYAETVLNEKLPITHRIGFARKIARAILNTRQIGTCSGNCKRLAIVDADRYEALLAENAARTPPRRVRVLYDSDLLGSGVFFDGIVTPETTLRNVVAESLARQTAEDGQPRRAGMWHSAVVANP